METMFKIGCARWMTFGMLATEVVIVLAVGVVMAGALTWLVMVKLGCCRRAAGRAGTACRKVASRRGRKAVRGCRQLSAPVFH